jgi:GntP family gluconate:H+ symporter
MHTAVASAVTMTGHDWRLVTAALVAIAVVILLITWLRVNPFLALVLGSGVLTLVAGFPVDKGVTSFSNGVGATFGGVGMLVALGAIVGRLLVDSGGAAEVVDSIIARVPTSALPWAMAAAAFLLGIPMFFEIGVVLLIPIVLLVAHRSQVPLMKVGIPALAGLSVLHGFVPPHPGPLIAISALHADLGMTLGLGLLLAIPCVIIAGPLFGTMIAPYARQHPPSDAVGGLTGVADQKREDIREETGEVSARTAPPPGGAQEPMPAAESAHATIQDTETRRPSTAITIATVLLPVVLMLLAAFGELTMDEDSQVRHVLSIIGTPIVALLAGTIMALFALGVAVGATKKGIAGSVDASLPPMAGTLLIIAAGGGFKQTLVDSGVGGLIGRLAEGANINVILLGWLVAVGIRLATGSATVSTITAAGIVAPLAGHLATPEVSLLVLAIGAGSLFFSHVNDVGFWMIKQYFGLSVWETIKTWSVMETIISVVGLIGALLLDLVIN